MNELVKKILYVINISLPFCYFSLLSILGLKHVSGESLFYWILFAISSSIVYFILFGSILSKRFFRPIDIGLYLVPLIVLLLYFISDNWSGLSYQTIILYILSVIPASFIATELGREQSINNYSKPLFIVSIIISLGVLSSFPALISTDLNDLIDVFAGGHYQALSYFASFAFLISSIYFSFYLKKYNFFLVISFLILFAIQIFGIILSGGRGGLVVVVAGLLLILYLKSSKGGFIPYLFFTCFALYFVLNILLSLNFDQSERIMDGAKRLVSYIDSGGINFASSSNRDIYYAQAIEYIKESPLYGYGLFTLYDNSPNPYFGLPGNFYAHNLFLDILIHGGILYLIFWVLIFVYFFIKLNKIISIDKTQVIILAPVLYSFIQLMFSGTYLQESLFWFSLYYVFSFPVNSLQKNESSYE